MAMTRMKALLFGSVEKIVLHCAPTRVEDVIKTHIQPEFSASVPVSIQPTLLGVEHIQVHYSAGLLRGAHADIMVLPGRKAPDGPGDGLPFAQLSVI
jgi:hypothetical protein